MTTFGISMGVSWREPLARIKDLAARAEQHGFDCLWVLDVQFTMKDVYVAMALAAEATDRIRIGTGVTTPFNRHPTVTAAAISAIDELSDGRAILGIGAGGNAIYPLGLRPASVAQTERLVVGLRQLLRGEEARFSKEEPAVRIKTGIASVPIYLAASKPRMLELAGRVADGVILNGPSRRDWVTEQLATIARGAASAGRVRGDIAVDLTVAVSIDDDRARAIDAVKPWVAAQARVFSSLPETPPWARSHRSELDAAARDYVYSQHLSRTAEHKTTVSDELASWMAVAGTADECRLRIQELVDTGIDRITMTLLPGGRERNVELLGREIVSRLASRPAAVPS
jgi:5,10-methylenetetrahydromethanopterin reductase